MHKCNKTYDVNHNLLLFSLRVSSDARNEVCIRLAPIYKTSDDRISVDSRFREVSQRNYTS